MRQWFYVLVLVMGFVCIPTLKVNGEAIVQPKIVQAAEGVFSIETLSQVFVGSGLLKTAPHIMDMIKPLIKGLHGEKSSNIPETLPELPYLLIGLPSEHLALMQLKGDGRLKLPSSGLGKEGYLLEITPQHIHLTADSPEGIFYGVLYLIQRLESEAAKTGISCGKIADWATLRWRGMHILFNGRQDVPQIERLLTEFMPRLRLNQLIIEINYFFDYKSHPEVAAQNPLTRADCQHLRELAQKNFIRIIPMLNCMGHQSWAKTTMSLLTTHPEFDETPNAPKDNMGLYCRSWCPSHPNISQFVSDLCDELIDAFHADAFHVGMDEVFLIGKCPRCKGKNPADLFAKAVNDLHKHLVGKRKVEMYLWGDRLLDGVGMKLGEWEASTNGTAPAIDKIAKDIVICDWHYELPDDFPSIAHLQQHGFRVIPSGWNLKESVKRFLGVGLKLQGAKLPGYLATTWTSAGGVVEGLLGVKAAREEGEKENKNADLPGAIRLGAKMAWEGG